MPTFSTMPSSPPMRWAQRATSGAITEASRTSATSANARPPADSICVAVPCTESADMSTQATCAPSRADSSAMARPLPMGTASPAGVGRWPAPTTSTLRPARRPRPGHWPRVSANTDCSGRISVGAWFMAFSGSGGGAGRFDVDLEVLQEAADHHVVADGQHQLGQLARRKAPLRLLEHRVRRLDVTHQLVGEGDHEALLLVECGRVAVALDQRRDLVVR